MTPTPAPTRSSLTQQAFWLLVAKMAGFVFALIFPLFLVRILDQSKYGTYKQMYLLMNTATSFLSMGFGLSAFYFFPRDPEKRGAVSLNVVLYQLAVGLVAALTLTFWPNCLVLLFSNPALVPYAPRMGMVLLLRMSGVFLENVATAQEDVKMSTIFIVGAQFTKSAVMLSALWFAGSLASILYGSMVQGVLQTTVLLWYLERSFPGFWRKIDWPLFRTQLGYAVPLGFAGILVGLRSEAHNYVVAHHVSAAAFAVYAVGCSELPVVGMIREVVGTVLIRRISELHHGGSYRAILLLTIRGMKKLAIFYWPLYVFLMVMAREFTRLLYTKRYDASVPILWINLAMIPLTILVMDPVLRAFAEQRYFLVRLQTALLLVMAVALLTVTPLWGPRGAITVVVLCAAAEMACVMWRVATLLNMSVGDIKLAAGIFKLGLSALAGGAVAWVVRRALPAYHPAVVLAICGMAFLPVYAISAYLLGAIERAEVRDLALQGKRMLRLA